MALGGGTFVTQNKVLAGSYINFVSAANASAVLSDRGIATIALDMDWGATGEVVEVTREEFYSNSLKYFGYPYDHDKMKGLRDLFKNIKTLYVYRLNGANGAKAMNVYAEAKYSGVRGNDLKVSFKPSVDNPSFVDVKTSFDGVVVDVQTVKTRDELKDNDYIVWGGFELSSGMDTGETLDGGTNGKIENAAHQAYHDAIQAYSFNAMGVMTNDESVKKLYVAFAKRMRDEVGMKFQLVLHNHAADYEGVVNVKNTVQGTQTDALVYWVTGAIAGCEVNKSNLNKVYDGEFTVNANYTQTQLTQAIKDGEFTVHRVGHDIRVLDDINSLVTVTPEKDEIFKDNQTIRVIDQIANDIAVLFNEKYLGVVPNDAAGRTSLWADIVKHHEELEAIRAIENFNEEDIVIAQGNSKKSVVVTDAVEPVNVMGMLYMTVTVA